MLILVELAAPSSPRRSRRATRPSTCTGRSPTAAVKRSSSCRWCPRSRQPASSGPQWSRLACSSATIDWHPRVNGYSGYLPPGYAEDVQLLNTFPSPESLARLQALDVRYVVLHLGVNQLHAATARGHRCQAPAGSDRTSLRGRVAHRPRRPRPSALDRLITGAGERGGGPRPGSCLGRRRATARAVWR